MKQVIKTERNKKPFQIWWEEATKQEFKALVDRYDPLMPIAVAVLKLVQHAIKDHYLPGYIRKEMPTKEMTNKLGERIIQGKN